MMTIRRRSWWLAIGILATCMAVAAYRWNASDALTQIQPPSRLSLDFENSNDHGYAGWSVCSECHSQRVEEFQQTRHFHALRTSDQVDFPQAFHTEGGSFAPHGSSVRFEMTASPQPTITTWRSSASGELTATQSSIAFVYGAGAGTDEVFFTRHGDQLFEAPVVWLCRRGEWGASSFDPHATGELSRPLSPQCLECHTVWVDYKRGTLNQYDQLQPELLGVTCERCHGPAKAHVDHHRAHPKDHIPARIVQPKSLNRDRLVDLCAQCHTNSVRHRRAPFSYRPGEPLESSFRPLEMQYPEEDRVANQVRYLKESRCYKNSETLTCITCHNPHRKPDPDKPLASSRSCASCHLPENCGAQSRLPEAVQGDCVSCHMPRRTKVQVNFETATGDIDFPAPRYEHRIAVYPEAEQEALYRWLASKTDAESNARRQQLGRSLSMHWAAVGDSAQAQGRFFTAIDGYQTALRFTDSPEIREKLEVVCEQNRKAKSLWFDGEHFKRERQLNQAISANLALLELQPRVAKVHTQLGTLFAAVGQFPAAIRHLDLATELDANDPSSRVMRGWLAYLNRNFDQALSFYRDAEEIDPWNAKLEFQISQCLIQLGNWSDAVESLEHVLRIDPNHAEACHELRRLLRERYSPTTALPKLVEAVKLTQGKQTELLLGLAELYRDLGQIASARQALEALHHTESPRNSTLESQIRSVEKTLH